MEYGEYCLKLEKISNLERKLKESIKAYITYYSRKKVIETIGDYEKNEEIKEKLDEEISHAIATDDLAISDYFLQEIEKAENSYQKSAARDILEKFWTHIAMARHIQL